MFFYNFHYDIFRKGPYLMLVILTTAIKVINKYTIKIIIIIIEVDIKYFLKDSSNMGLLIFIIISLFIDFIHFGNLSVNLINRDSVRSVIDIR